MKGFWSDKRANGHPLEPGTVCWVTDLEDGTHPIYTYGRDQSEVFEKLSRQNANAQLALARRAAGFPSPAAPPAPAARTISPDQIMQATADLQNPAKSGAAIATLIESATGLDPVQLARQHYAQTAMEWEMHTPAFYPHPGNRQLVGDRAIRLAGGKPGLVSRDVIELAFQQLQAEGLLFERADEALPPNPNTPTLTTFPGESQVQPTERPRGTRYATGARSTNFSAPQAAQTRVLKYTEEQIRTMPERERMKVFNDPDYIAACEYYFSGARA
jgi:hypothetical protein